MQRSHKNIIVIHSGDDPNNGADAAGVTSSLPNEKAERLSNVALRMIRFPTVRDRTGLSRSTIWRLERQGEFPRHRRISPNAVGWLEHEVDAWIMRRMAG
jgi:prophage regulatory protein